MSSTATFDRLVSSITFAGSLISFLATSTVLACYIYYRNEQRSFRHAIVFNLTLSEFINSLNNTISGSIYLRDHALQPGTACTVNGFVGQLSVQASDFSVLTIAVVTLLTVVRTTYLPDTSTPRKVLVCLSVWIVPFITAITATAMGTMSPVSGNWCWISSKRVVLRYALTHGWRIGIIFCTVGIYVYIWWYMNRHFRSIVSTVGSDLSQASQKGRSRYKGFSKVPDKGNQQETDTEMAAIGKAEAPHGMGDWKLSSPDVAYVGGSLDPGRDVEYGRGISRGPASSTGSDSKDFDDYDDHLQSPTRKFSTASPQSVTVAASAYNGPLTPNTVGSELPQRRIAQQMEREIKRMLLLNAYPIMYVLLWIPGLTNRFMEATGHTSQSHVLAALQSSSQFVGLANAITYGFNKGLRGKLKAWWKARKSASRQ